MAHFTALTSSQVQNILDKNGGVAVVDCFAVWCGPCKMIAPIADQFSSDFRVPLIKVDVDQSEELNEAYQIQCMPTFLLIKGKWNNVISRLSGADREQLKNMFNNAAKNK
jgi:thioredoxin 1